MLYTSMNSVNHLHGTESFSLFFSNKKHTDVTSTSSSSFYWPW